jgi:dTDP-4-amino-4,6-dideoxygalactose transaminase
MNELQAAYGLVQLKHIDDYISERKTIADHYRKKLAAVSGLSFLDNIKGIRYSYTYFPVLIDAEHYGRTRDEVYEFLKAHNIYGRRYFYPLISQFPTYKGLPSSDPANLPVATQVSGQVICLPIYPSLKFTEIERIVTMLKRGTR